MSDDKIEVVETKFKKEDQDFINENMPKELGRKLLNPINVIRLQRMIFKLPLEDRNKVIQDPKSVKFDELSKEGQKIYSETINKILGIKKK